MSEKVKKGWRVNPLCSEMVTIMAALTNKKEGEIVEDCIAQSMGRFLGYYVTIVQPRSRPLGGYLVSPNNINQLSELEQAQVKEINRLYQQYQEEKEGN